MQMNTKNYEQQDLHVHPLQKLIESNFSLICLTNYAIDVQVVDIPMYNESLSVCLCINPKV